MKRQTKVTEKKKSEEGEEEAMKGQNRFTRREMLKLSGTVAAGSLLVACAPTVTSTVASTLVPPTVAPTAVPPTVAPTAVLPTVAPTKVLPTSAPAPAGAVTFEMFDPTGAFEVTKLHAPRLDTLEGKTICELSNDSWQAQRTFPYLRELIKTQYPTAKIIPYTEFPVGSEAIQTQKAADALKAAGCDVAIIGNGG